MLSLHAVISFSLMEFLYQEEILHLSVTSSIIQVKLHHVVTPASSTYSVEGLG